MKKLLLILIFFLNLGIIFYFWFIKSGDLLFLGPAGLFISLGRITGLLAVYLVLWQLVLIGRVKFLEKVFGLDRLAIVHHFNGLLSWLFIILHPIFLIIGYGKSGQRGFWEQTGEFLWRGDDLLTAFLSLVIFIGVIFVSVAAIKKRLKYEAWYFIHLLTYLGIIWAFGHQLELGNDLRNIYFAVYWYLLYIGAVGLLVYFRFLKPAYLFYSHRFYVERVVRENDQVVSLYIGGRDIQKFNYQSGQFAIFRFLDKKLFLEAHPFSFSSLPGDNYFRITIKNLGDFTATLAGRLQPRTPVLIDGPHGVFTTKRTVNQKLALIAGGIGITPIYAIFAGNSTSDQVLFYTEQTVDKLIFRKELEILQGTKRKIHYILSQANVNNSETGRLDEEKIKRSLPDYLERDFFICGPPLMIKAIRQTLINLGIRQRRIYFEKFSLS